MPRRNSLHAFSRYLWAIWLAPALGCIHSQTDLRDRLEQRVTPVKIGPDNSPRLAESARVDRPTTDAQVQPAAASQPSQAVNAAVESPRPPSLPPAIEGATAPIGSDSPRSTAPALPADSNEAALDAIAASGKPVTVAEAISLAFANQPRLRAQLETIRQARGAEQIAFSAFLPLAAGAYSVGGYSVGVGGNELHVSPGLPNFNYVPFLGFAPVGLHVTTPYELAELRVQWVLLDFGRRLGRYQQARLANAIAGLQTDRAYQTVANEVAVAYYNVLRSQALRRTAKDAQRRAEEELADSRKREQEGVVEREVVLRSEVQQAETQQQLHAATEAEFVALAALNLAVGLKSDQPIRLVDEPEVPPVRLSLADSLQMAIHERREFNVIRDTVEIAAEGTRIARADFAPRVTADGTLFNFRQQSLNDHMDFRLGYIRLEWILFEGGRRIAAARVAESQVRQAMAQAESVADNIAFQVNEAYRATVTSWVGIEDARPAVAQSRENYRLVQLRLREGAAIPSEIADAQASVTRSEQNFFNARYNYLIALDRLNYAMGIGQTPGSHSAINH
jgi:outer membrane protein TolC